MSCCPSSSPTRRIRARPRWGAAYSLERRHRRWTWTGGWPGSSNSAGPSSVSFGGLINNELAAGCTDPDKLKSAYRAVVDRYNVSSIDLDVEGEALSDPAAAGPAFARPIAALQQDRQRDGKGLSVWLTLPADPNGLTTAGSDAVRRMIAAGVDLAGVNIMTMDYGGSKLAGRSMYENAVSAAEATHGQLTDLYRAPAASWAARPCGARSASPR